MAEFLIAGGGIAGSALAIMLGRQGRTVELFERREFPREKPCGEGLMPAGVAVLNQLGLAKETGGVAFRGVRYHLGSRRVEGRFPRIPGFPGYGIGQRRYRLDCALFQAASATPGVSARTGAPVESLLRENGRVTGAVIGGKAHHADFVIAADGSHSEIRSLLGWSLPPVRKRIGARAHFRLASGRPQNPWVNIVLVPQGEFYVTPLPGDEVGLALLTQGDALEPTLEASFAHWRRQEPFLAAYLEGAEQVTELLAMSPLSSRSRFGSAPGVVLLGDAAGSTDPVTGGGMAQALLCALLLARYLSLHNAGDATWLPLFERDRRALLKDYQQLTAHVLRLEGRPRLAAFSLRLLDTWPGLLSHLVGVAGGLKPLVGFRSATETLLPELRLAHSPD